MSKLELMLQKLDEDCRKRREEHAKSFIEKYDRNFDDDDVIDLRTLQVVKKKGKSKKKPNKSFIKQNNAKNQVIEFGDLTSYAIGSEGKKYTRAIKKYLKKVTDDSAVGQEIEENAFIEADSSIKSAKKPKNRSDKSYNLEKKDLSGDLSRCNQSKNETLPLNNANTPYFRLLNHYYLPNAKEDSLSCERSQKDWTIQRKMKKPVPKIRNSAYNQPSRHSSKLSALSKDFSNCSLTDKMDTRKIFPKSSRTKFDDHEDNMSETTKDNIPKVLNSSIVKNVSVKRKSLSKNLNHNLKILNKKLADTLSAEKTHCKGEENMTDITKPNKLLHDCSTSSDTVSQKSLNPISVDTCIPCNDKNLPKNSDDIPPIVNNILPKKVLPISQPVDSIQNFKYGPYRTAATEILGKSSESEISNNSLTSESTVTNSDHVKLQRCFILLHPITLPKNVPACSFKSPESRCDFSPSQNITTGPQCTLMKKGISDNSINESIRKLSKEESNHMNVLMQNKTPTTGIKHHRPGCSHSGSTTFSDCKNYCESKSQNNLNSIEVKTCKQFPSKDNSRLQKKDLLQESAAENPNQCYIKGGNKLSGKGTSDESNIIKDCPRMSTPMAASYSPISRKDYSFPCSVNVNVSSGSNHPVTRSNNRIGYSKDNCKIFSSNNELDTGKNTPNKDISTPQIVKKDLRHRKMSASRTCPAPETSDNSTKNDVCPLETVERYPIRRKISASHASSASEISDASTKTGISSPDIVKRLKGRNVLEATPNNCSSYGKSSNSSKANNVAPHLMRKHRSSKLFPHSTSPPSVDVSNKQDTYFSFKKFFDFTKLWCKRQKLSLENSQNSSDSCPKIDRVLRSKQKDSVRNRKSELSNNSCFRPESFVSPLSKRPKFAPNFPIDCLSV